MSEIGNRRLNAACGIGGTILFLLAVAVLGDTPDPTRYFSPDVQQQFVAQLFLLWVLITAALCLRTPAPPRD